MVIIYSIFVVLDIFDIIQLEVYPELWLILSVIMQLIYINKQNNDIEVSKKQNVTNIILYYIIFSLLSIFIIYFYITTLWKIEYTFNEINIYSNNIKQNLINSNAVYTGEQYYAICKNGKCGYINENGEEKIPCENDRLTDFSFMIVNGNYYAVAVAVKDGIYRIITENNETIYSGETLIPWINDLTDFPIYEDDWSNDKLKLSFILQLIGESNNPDLPYIDNEYKKNNSLIATRIPGEDASYEYKDDNFSINFKAPEEVADGITTFLVTVTNQNNEAKTSKKYIPTDYYSPYSDYLEIDLYSDGYIPFYDFQTDYSYNTNGNRLGWLSNGNENYISSGLKILDIRNNIIILKQQGANNVLFVNLQGQLLLQAKEIELCDNGYIIKNLNDKMVFIDNNLTQKTDEFSYILKTYNGNQQLICTNINEDGIVETVLLDNQGNILSNIYEMIFESTSNLQSYLSNDMNYEDYISFELSDYCIMGDLYYYLEQLQ